MGSIAINRKKCDLCRVCVKVCPFSAITLVNDIPEIGQACKMCGICIKECPQKAISTIDDKRSPVDKDSWRGIMVFAECTEDGVHPVTFELIGEAKKLAAKIGHPVYAVIAGKDLSQKALMLIEHGVDRTFVYDNGQLEHFRVDIYTNILEDCIGRIKPSVVLIGATATGRSLAPRVAARFRAGLTADCTKLEMRQNTDLVQIRPAFGGNIMAQIITGDTRPQFATVRYKVMDKAGKMEDAKGMSEICPIHGKLLKSRIEMLETRKKPYETDITEAEILVAVGRGLKSRRDIAMIEELSGLLGAETASTRGLVEDGWVHYTKQIGLSGRTVKPKLMITCGVSGAVQFAAGMKESACIIAINTDKDAPIFRIAHFGIVGDLYEVIPELISRIREGGRIDAV